MAREYGDRLDQWQNLDCTPPTEEVMHAADVCIVDNICRHSIVADEPVTAEDIETVHLLRQALGLEEYLGHNSDHHMGSSKAKPKIRERGKW